MTGELLMLWRQAANNCLLIMDLVLDGILILYILSHFRVYGREAWKLVRVRAAFWMDFHLIGLTLQRMWGVVLLRAYAKGQDAMAVEAHFPLFFVGSVIAVIGLAGTIYTFTPLAGQEHPGFWKRTGPLLLAITAAIMFTAVMSNA